MNEIAIDMSPSESPESTHKLLSAKYACSSPPKEECSTESTADTLQTEFRLQLLPAVNHSLVYYEEILDHLKSQENRLKIRSPETILQNHKITAELRAKMADWIIEVICKAECTQQTLFMAVNIIDRFLENAKQSYKGSEIHLIGVVAMLLASKLEDVTGMDITFMYEQVVHKKITKREMADFELRIIEGIGFAVCAPTELDFLEVYSENLSESITGSILSKAKYIATLNLHSLAISAIKPSLKAAASICMSIRDDTGTSPDQELLNKLASLSSASIEEIQETEKRVEQHKAEFKKLYPKLKNALNYMQSGCLL